jgi:hypothetical protein
MQRFIYGTAREMRDAIIAHLVGAKHEDVERQALGNAMGILCKAPNCGVIFCIGFPVLERDPSVLGVAYRDFLTSESARTQVLTDLLMEARERRRRLTMPGMPSTCWEKILDEELY